MAQSPAPSDPSSQAEDLYAQYLSQRESPAGVDIEAWCARHGGQAEALRRLHAQYAQWKSIFDRLAGSAPQGEGGKRLADELKERYGDVDPGVSLDGGRPRDDSGPSSDLLRRLRTHAPSNSRYRLLGEVGRGGMGAVIRVWDEDLRRTLAMKVVLGKEDALGRGPTPPVDSKTLGRFLEEAQITGQLDHPGIVPVHELGLGSDGQVYFTMRLVRGVDLRTIFQHVEQGLDGWSTTRALGVMLKVCEAMAYAHSKGVIHRDLKPANIMVGRYGEVYVMDWGLARVAGGKELHDLRLKDQPPPSSQSVRTERREERTESPDSPLVTMDGDVMGTPAYMPPEQARGELANLGAHSDVYAVGAMLYHLLLVKHIEMPYVPKGARMSQHRVLMSVIEESPKGLAGYDKTVPAPLVAIVEKAMERDIARRYRDMDELAADLRAYIEGRVVKAYETGTWAETKQWIKRNKPLSAALATIVLLAFGGLFWVNAKNSDLVVANTAAFRARNEMFDVLFKAVRSHEDDVASLAAGRMIEMSKDEPQTLLDLGVHIGDRSSLRPPSVITADAIDLDTHGRITLAKLYSGDGSARYAVAVNGPPGLRIFNESSELLDVQAASLQLEIWVADLTGDHVDDLVCVHNEHFGTDVGATRLLILAGVPEGESRAFETYLLEQNGPSDFRSEQVELLAQKDGSNLVRRTCTRAEGRTRESSDLAIGQSRTYRWSTEDSEFLPID